MNEVHDFFYGQTGNGRTHGQWPMIPRGAPTFVAGSRIRPGTVCSNCGLELNQLNSVVASKKVDGAKVFSHTKCPTTRERQAMRRATAETHGN